MKKGNMFLNVKNLFNEFTKEEKQKYPYEIVGLETEKYKKILVIQLEGHLIQRRRPGDIILDDAMIEGLPPKAIKAITYLAVLEQLAPDHQLVGLELNQKLQEYFVTLKNHVDESVAKKSASSVSKDSAFVKKLSPEDANRIGYMAGVSDTIKERHAK
ncbi:MAG: hypothetical protein P1U32_01675 [Legionellaceae bacterium]|nr:hypothetical protein [Legionellaceae bacterium]